MLNEQDSGHDAPRNENARKAKPMAADPSTLSPRQIVAELDRFIVGQGDARIRGCYPSVVPLGDRSAEDVGQHVAG